MAKRNAIPKAVSKMYRDAGVELVRAYGYPRSSSVGIHLLNPNKYEMEAALESAKRDLFPTVFMYFEEASEQPSPSCDNSPRLTLREQWALERRASFRLIQGGAA